MIGENRIIRRSKELPARHPRSTAISMNRDRPTRLVQLSHTIGREHRVLNRVLRLKPPIPRHQRRPTRPLHPQRRARRNPRPHKPDRRITRLHERRRTTRRTPQPRSRPSVLPSLYRNQHSPNQAQILITPRRRTLHPTHRTGQHQPTNQQRERESSRARPNLEPVITPIIGTPPRNLSRLAGGTGDCGGAGRRGR